MNRRFVAIVAGFLTIANAVAWPPAAVAVGPQSGPRLTAAMARPQEAAALAARAQAPIGSQVAVTQLTAQPAATFAGTLVTFQTVLSSARDFSGLTVSLEVYGPKWASVFTYRRRLDIAAQVSQPLSASWAIPLSEPSGTYHVLVNVFSGDWKVHYAELCCTDVPVQSSSGPIALGAWVPGANKNAGAVDQYARLTGRYPAIVNYYQSWQIPNARSLNVGLLRAYQRRGVTPMISWEPDVPNSRILDGSHDAFIFQYARAAAAYGKPILLRFAWEVNGTWTAWSPGVNGNTSASFVAAWRHVHDIFAAAHANNVKWVWAPNVVFEGSIPFADIYPGDAYVDWMALDGYNWGPVGPWHSWTSAYELFGPSITSLMSLSAKPIMISEIASTEQGGGKAAWITDWYLRDLPTHFPRVRAVAWFDENKEADWRVNSSSASLAAYRQVVLSPLYQGHLP